MAREEEEEFLCWEAGGNKEAALEGRGSWQPLESELEQPSSVFAVLRPAMDMEGSTAFRDRIRMTLPHQLLGNAPICKAEHVISSHGRNANVCSAWSPGSQVHQQKAPSSQPYQG